jgi:hypothetical protein
MEAQWYLWLDAQWARLESLALYPASAELAATPARSWGAAAAWLGQWVEHARLPPADSDDAARCARVFAALQAALLPAYADADSDADAKAGVAGAEVNAGGVGWAEAWRGAWSVHGKAIAPYWNQFLASACVVLCARPLGLAAVLAGSELWALVVPVLAERILAGDALWSGAGKGAGAGAGAGAGSSGGQVVALPLTWERWRALYQWFGEAAQNADMERWRARWLAQLRAVALEVLDTAADMSGLLRHARLAAATHVPANWRPVACWATVDLSTREQLAGRARVALDHEDWGVFEAAWLKESVDDGGTGRNADAPAPLERWTCSPFAAELATLELAAAIEREDMRATQALWNGSSAMRAAELKLEIKTEPAPEPEPEPDWAQLESDWETLTALFAWTSAVMVVALLLLVWRAMAGAAGAGVGAEAEPSAKETGTSLSSGPEGSLDTNDSDSEQ